MTDNTAPIALRWDGETFVPATPRFAMQADRDYAVDEVCVMVRHEPRSKASHDHFFACVDDAWKNLPEDLADEFPSSEHLRAWGLVKAGYADKSIIKCATNADAITCAATCTKKGDKIKIVEVMGKIVTVWTPHSQSMKAMGNARFQESKTKVLDVLAGMLRVDPDALASNAARAA